MNWEDVYKRQKEKPLELYLKTNYIVVFEILKMLKMEEVTNEHDFSSAKYRKVARMPKKAWNKYHVLPLLVRIKFWCTPQQGVKHTDRIARIKISESVAYQMSTTIRTIKKCGLEPGDMLFYWKRTPLMVWFAFGTEGRWENLKPFIENFDNRDKVKVQKMKEIIYWSGYKSRENIERLKQFYNTEVYDEWMKVRKE